MVKNNKYSDIVVLYRKSYLSDNLKDVFDVNHIPYFFKGTKETISNFTNPKKKLNLIFDNNEKLNWIKQSLQKEYEKMKLQSQNRVLFSTIHQIKGLEFKIVFLMGFEKETFMDDFCHKFNIKEERRLAYIAITRVKEQLYITSVAERYVFGGYQKLKPVSFLQEMGINKL
ncbi:3'-5' exonuclease ['Catharanthus roseus' aster yellows phytoplasma]|uniref:ATP-dependent helicase n=1 Tax='Catharanthus roseus' aster yellows phytoplasma TaxID=1193712 RepID=A0A4P6M985_9MOLU|nr:3'-5' exonuclease ['Catharanthus roseus' aster yellows phytoplasma]QBF23959.1 ATP-dependent helicase ['Catharanthus roseus' aster yellows phytoplasma]